MFDETTLFAVAAPVEARAVLRSAGADPGLADVQWHLHLLSPSSVLLVTGVGKVNAGAAIARCARAELHSRIISIGIAGSLPGSGLKLADVVVASVSVYADEGLETPGGFLDCAAMGFPLVPGADSGDDRRDGSGSVGRALFSADPDMLRTVGPMAAQVGPIATVSTCSGTDQLASQVQERTGGLAECMEGAAVAHVAHRLSIPFLEVRIISNTTGDRERQIWDLGGAIDTLAGLAGRLLR